METRIEYCLIMLYITNDKSYLRPSVRKASPMNVISTPRGLALQMCAGMDGLLPTSEASMWSQFRP